LDLMIDFGYNEYQIREKFGSYSLIKKYIRENKKNATSFTRTRTDNSVKGDAFLELEKHGVLIEDIKKVLQAKEIDRKTKTYRYLKNRLQHRNIDKILMSKKGLIILNLNSKKDRVVGFQIKTFSKNNAYLTYD